MNTVVKKGLQFNIYKTVIGPFSILLSFFLLSYAPVREYKIFSLLPAIYGVLNLVFQFNNKSTNGLSFNIINILMFIRYDITVAMSVLAKYYSGVNIYNNYKQVFYVMVYEMVFVFCAMAIYFLRQDKNSPQEYERFQIKKTDDNLILKIFYVFVMVSVVLVVFTNANARNTLFNFSFLSAKEDAIDSNDVLSGPQFVFFKIGVNVIYGVIITVVLKITQNRNFLSFLLCIFVSVLFISCNWTGGGSISRWGLVTSFFVSFMVLSKAFPKYRKPLFIIGLIVFVLIILLSSISKLIEHHASSTDEALSDIFSAEYFNEYFQGPFPVGNGIRIMNVFENKINFTTFLDDTISAYPWLNKLFYENGNLTNLFYLDYLNQNDKIIPTIIQGYAHFGFVGAPLFSGLLAYIALICEQAIKRSKNIIFTIAAVQIAVWCSLFMAVNIFIIQRTTMYFVLLLFVYWIDKKFKVRYR